MKYLPFDFFLLYKPYFWLVGTRILKNIFSSSYPTTDIFKQGNEHLGLQANFDIHLVSHD